MTVNTVSNKHTLNDPSYWRKQLKNECCTHKYRTSMYIHFWWIYVCNDVDLKLSNLLVLNPKRKNSDYVDK